MKSLSMLSFTLVGLVGALALAGCGGLGDPTGATCPTGSTLTYASFGQAFMTTHCTRCHSAEAADRDGAPGGVNFDTVEEIRTRKSDIDRAAGSGPDATNTWMPETNASHPAPTDAERAMLSEWLACGAL